MKVDSVKRFQKGRLSSTKDAYYFPHDSNAKDDPKCVLLIEQLGMEGYGIYWMLIEVLREQPDYTYPLALLPALARRYNTTYEKVKTVVCAYDLFTIKEDKIFFSDSLSRRMQILEEKRIRRSEAGRLGMDRRWKGNNVIAPLSQCDSDDITSKVDESKVYKKDNVERTAIDFFPPSLTDVVEYIRSNGYTSVDPEQFIDYYTANGWMIGKSKMKDWQAAIRNWNRKGAATKTENEQNTIPV